MAGKVEGSGERGGGVRNLRRAASPGVLSLERGRELGEAKRERGVWGGDAGGDSATEEKRGEII